MTRRRPVIRPALIMMLLFLLMVPAGVALASGEFLPPPTVPSAVPSAAPLYDRYPVWHYVYGANLQGADTIYRLFYTMNLLQVGKAWLLKLSIRAVEYAVHFDLSGPLVGKAQLGMRALVDSLWHADAGALVVAGLVCAGAIALWYGAFPTTRGAGVRVLGGAAIILVCAYALFEVAPQTMTQTAGIARALDGQILHAAGSVAVPDGSGDPRDRLLRAAGEAAWRSLVLKPWVDGEFMNGAEAKSQYQDGDVEGGKWLAVPPSSRMKQYRFMSTEELRDFAQWDENTTIDYLPRRMVMALASALITLVYAGALLIVAGGILYYQLLLLAILALAPLWLLVALFHPAGLSVAKGTVIRAIGSVVFQVTLTAVLAVLLVLTPAVAEVAAPLGWSGQGLLLALAAAVLCRYRFRWLRWGRDSRSEQRPAWTVPWVFARRRETDRVRVVPAAAAATAVYPALREESRPAAAAEADASSERGTMALSELAEEMRRLRFRLARPEADASSEVLLPTADERQAVVQAAPGRGGGQARADAATPTVAGSLKPSDPRRPEEWRVLRKR